jgi:hypothetical protein
MICFARFPRVAATCCPAGRLTLGFLCRAPVGGFWFGAGLPRPAKGKRGLRVDPPSPRLWRDKQMRVESTGEKQKVESRKQKFGWD